MKKISAISNDQQSDELFLDANLPTDCVFIFDCGRGIRAHKSILSLFSPVFDKMFNGALAADEIFITDIEIDDFSLMLTYLYTEQINIGSVLHAWSLFYIAEKYLLQSFQMECVRYIKSNFNINNLLMNFEYAEVYRAREILDACLKDIVGYFRGFFTEHCDYHMKSTTLEQILQQKNLNINSKELILGILNWAVVECSSQQIFSSPDNIIRLLASNKILSYLVNLNFSENTCDNFIKDCVNLMKKYKHVTIPQRITLKEGASAYCKCRSLYKIARRIDLNKQTDVLFSNITINKNCLLYGFDILTESLQFYNQRPKYVGLIKIILHEFDNPGDVIETSFSKNFLYESSVFIPLSKVAFLDYKKMYTVKISYENMDVCKAGNKSSVLCYYMSNELTNDTTGLTFSFAELSGSVIRGISCYPI